MTDTEPSALQGSPGARPARRSLALVVAVGLAVVFAVVASVFAVLLAQDADEGSDLRAAAGGFAEVLVTYDHETPEVHRDAVLERSTGSFAAEYHEAFDQGLGDLISDLEATSRGFVKDVYTTEIERGQALAIVVLDVENDGSGGPRRLYDVYVRLTMIEVEGTWLVDDVTDLSFGGAGASPGGDLPVTSDTTTSTTTSVP